MLTEQQLKAAAKKHFDAEDARDLDLIVETVSEDVEYLVREPYYPDDDQAITRRFGQGAVRDLWSGYYDRFDSIKIECLEEEMVAFPERGLVFCHVKILATPNQDFFGFPAGKAIRSMVGAMCQFNDEGKMTSETVYGDMGAVLNGVARMREYLKETGAA